MDAPKFSSFFFKLLKKKKASDVPSRAASTREGNEGRTSVTGLSAEQKGRIPVIGWSCTAANCRRCCCRGQVTSCGDDEGDEVDGDDGDISG